MILFSLMCLAGHLQNICAGNQYARKKEVCAG